jgi:hypothetical protein
MAESKIVATDRLRKEGRWEEASVWRDEKSKQLRTDGQARAESNESSWDAMLKQFTPLPPSDHAPAAGTSWQDFTTSSRFVASLRDGIP